MLKKNLLFRILAIVIAISVSLNINAQTKPYKVACVGFYNLENLFDTIDSPDTYDYEFLPSGKKLWNTERYYKKLNKLADVISQVGDEVISGGPHILGVSEIENALVLEDLVKMPKLLASNYGVIHYDSPDERGVDVGLLYRKDYFEILHTSSHVLIFDFDTSDQTRAQLVVTGLYDGDTLNFIVNHWPSRGGGELASRPKRNAAGDLSRHLVDSMLALNPNAKIIMMGDLNDNPDNASVKKHFNAKRNIQRLKGTQMYNPYYNVFKKGVGTTAYRDAWSLFDQLIISQSLISKNKSTYIFWKANIFRKKFLIGKEGRYEGYPFRTFSFDRFQNGYSDHFPVYLFLIKDK